jgi:hypothetical protein
MQSHGRTWSQLNIAGYVADRINSLGGRILIVIDLYHERINIEDIEHTFQSGLHFALK